MTLHQRHTHGRVHGHELHKRDGHGDETKHEKEDGQPQEKQQNDGGNGNGDVATAVSVVYVTLPKTFSGPAVMSTLTGGSTPTNNAQPPEQTSATGKSSGDDGNTKASPSASAKSGPDPTHSASTVQTTSLETAPPRTTLATSTSNSGAGALGAGTSASASASLIPGTSLQGTNNAAASSQPTSSMSGGAAAGLAVGLILGIALVAGAIYFFYRKRTRLGKHEELMNEKHASLTNGAGTRNPETAFRPVSVQSTRTTPTAPRLSLRPVTQFAPMLSGNANKSNTNLNAANPSLAVSEKSQSSWERRPSNTSSNNAREDPFADATMISEKQARPESPPTNPFDQPQRTSGDSTHSTAPQSSASIAPAVAATSAAVVASAAAVSEKNGRPNSKASVESSTPPTPTSVRSNPAGPVMAGGSGSPPAPRAPNNVHRVQLDFKPSMDDELELRSGQLVRLLHEYDDGWALCIRMDRSQQGVAPRTCLSKLPVKPRPQGPPPNGRPGPPPQGRPGTPQGRPGTSSGRPGTSHGPGPQSRPGTSHGPRGPPGPGPRGPPSPPGPHGPNGAMVPRPLTPSQANRDRSQSVTSGEASTGVPPRKPVPGQAM